MDGNCDLRHAPRKPYLCLAATSRVSPTNFPENGCDFVYIWSHLLPSCSRSSSALQLNTTTTTSKNTSSFSITSSLRHNGSGCRSSSSWIQPHQHVQPAHIWQPLLTPTWPTKHAQSNLLRGNVRVRNLRRSTHLPLLRSGSLLPRGRLRLRMSYVRLL